MLALKYEYHDALIEKIEKTNVGFILYMDLYPIFYPVRPKIQLSFIGVTNLQKCHDWLDFLLGEFDDSENYLGARIGHINLNITNTHLSFFIACNCMNILNVKCTSFTELEIGKEIPIVGELENILTAIENSDFTFEQLQNDKSCFESKHFITEFNKEEQEFSFTYIDERNDEFFFQLYVNQIKDICKGKIKSVWVVPKQ
jgi:hypothetical protein